MPKYRYKNLIFFLIKIIKKRGLVNFIFASRVLHVIHVFYSSLISAVSLFYFYDISFRVLRQKKLRILETISVSWTEYGYSYFSYSCDHISK